MLDYSFTQVTKECANPQCRVQFIGPINRLYCTLNCQRSAKMKRRRDKERKVTPKVEEHKVTLNPLVELLDATARLYKIDPKKEPILFGGELPVWTPPDYVEWIKQPNGNVMMCAKTPNLIEMMKLGKIEGKIELKEIL